MADGIGAEASMSNHTKGPWVVVDWSFMYRLKIENAANKNLSKPPLAAISYDSKDERGQALANATLMAAAPDLLEALQSLVSKIGNDEWFEEWRKEAELAIDKAKVADQ
jgi:hypothetical protein